MWDKTPGMHYAVWKTALSFARKAHYLLLQPTGSSPKHQCWLQTAPIAVPNSTGPSLSASPACWLYLGQIASLCGAPRPSEDLQNMLEAAHLQGRQWPQLPRQILQVFEAAVDVTSIPRGSTCSLCEERWLWDQTFQGGSIIWVTSCFTSDAKHKAQKKEKLQVSEGIMCFSTHLLWSCLPNSRILSNYDRVKYQNKHAENIHISESCVMRN